MPQEKAPFDAVVAEYFAAYNRIIDEYPHLGISHILKKADILAICRNETKRIIVFEIPDDDHLHHILIPKTGHCIHN